MACHFATVFSIVVSGLGRRMRVASDRELVKYSLCNSHADFERIPFRSKTVSELSKSIKKELNVKKKFFYIYQIRNNHTHSKMAWLV